MSQQFNSVSLCYCMEPVIRPGSGVDFLPTAPELDVAILIELGKLLP